jgi:23S rRNA (guanosine2251-2'-O)-methyltransferase
MQKLKLEELKRFSVDEFKDAPKHPIVLVLDNVRSMSNVGSMFRTADAFRLERLYLCGITATPPHREIYKTAIGATESMAWTYAPTTKEVVLNLHQQGYKIVAVEQAHGSVYLNNFEIDTTAKYAFVMGNEIDGVSNDVMELIDACVEIPQFGSKHSFNVSISAGIVLWHVMQKFL